MYSCFAFSKLVSGILFFSLSNVSRMFFAMSALMRIVLVGFGSGLFMLMNAMSISFLSLMVSMIFLSWSLYGFNIMSP